MSFWSNLLARAARRRAGAETVARRDDTDLRSPHVEPVLATPNGMADEALDLGARAIETLPAVEPPHPVQPPLPVETENERLLRETLAFVSGESDQPPQADTASPLHDALMETLRHLRVALDWESGHLRTARSRIASPLSEATLADVIWPASWTPLMQATRAVLTHIVPRHKAAIVVGMRDEGLAIIDWIAHHRALGFAAIFVYANDNNDNSQPLLEALAAQGIIHLIENEVPPGSNPQTKAYAHSLWLLTELRDYDWVFYADADEFLVLSDAGDQRIDRVLDQAAAAAPDVSAVLYHWRWVVSDYQFAWHDAPVAQRFSHAVPHGSFKSIVRLRHVTTMIRVHFPDVIAERVFLNGSLEPIPLAAEADPESMWRYTTAEYAGGAIQHYWCKSFEEFLIKRRRGAIASLDGSEAFKRSIDQFFEWNKPLEQAQATPLPTAIEERVEAERRMLLALPGIETLRQGAIAGFRSILYDLGGPAAALKLYVDSAAQHGVAPRFGGLVAPDHAGMSYQTLMAALHKALSPRTYFEIGPPQADGGIFALANCASIAVDPSCRADAASQGEKPACLLFRSGADEFFKTYEPSVLFGRPIDLAFLDGLHLYEALLADFMRTEKHSRPGTVIVMHDCLPSDVFMARRDFADMSYKAVEVHNGWWTGDVWKVALILRRYRPDLTIRALDCAPTGAVLVTDLDPASTVLETNFDTIVEEYAALSLADLGLPRMYALAAMEDANEAIGSHGIGAPARAAVERAGLEIEIPGGETVAAAALAAETVHD